MPQSLLVLYLVLWISLTCLLLKVTSFIFTNKTNPKSLKTSPDNWLWPWYQ